jgi:hypothetical protein
MARKPWVLDTDTKGTGANMVPLDKVEKKDASAPARGPGRRVAPPRDIGKPKAEGAHWSTPLPPGHVRKKATGEIGKVQAVDPKAGTATVRWLKSGAVSTVPISTVSRS